MKKLAEECFILPRVEIDRVLRDREFSGSVMLKTKAQPELSLLVKWTYCAAAREPAIRLDYRWRGENIGYVVRLVGQHCFGGKRLALKFVCPSCEQTSYKIFLPTQNGGKVFLCRLCSAIDYLSHRRPGKASLASVYRLNQDIESMERQLLKLRERHQRLYLSFGAR
jgi:hypothetical protein